MHAFFSRPNCLMLRQGAGAGGEALRRALESRRCGSSRTRNGRPDRGPFRSGGRIWTGDFRDMQSQARRRVGAEAPYHDCAQPGLGPIAERLNGCSRPGDSAPRSWLRVARILSPLLHRSALVSTPSRCRLRQARSTARSLCHCSAQAVEDGVPENPVSCESQEGEFGLEIGRLI